MRTLKRWILHLRCRWLSWKTGEPVVILRNGGKPRPILLRDLPPTGDAIDLVGNSVSRCDNGDWIKWHFRFPPS